MDRQEFVDELWMRELKGGVVLSEYSAFLAKDAETAFVAGAYIATIVLCCSAIEVHLKFESMAGGSLSKLIDGSDLDERLKRDLQELRKIRNEWVHVTSPELDEELQVNPNEVYRKAAEAATLSFECMVRTFCTNQYV